MTEVAHELNRKGHEVDVFALHPDGDRFYVKTTNQSQLKQPLLDLASQLVHKSYQLELKRMPSWMIHQEIDRCAYEMAAARIVDFSRYDIIHAQEVLSSLAFSRIKPKHVPLIATLHGCYTWDVSRGLGYASLPDDLNGAYLKLTERYGAMTPDATIVPSQWLKNLLADQFGVPARQLTVIPYGHDVRAFFKNMENETDIKFPKDQKVIFTHARLDKVKGHEYLLDALAQLQHRSDWCCYIAGDGDNRDALIEQVHRLRLNHRVTFLGARGDIPALLRQVDIEVLPSVSENLPNVVCEAQLAGKAIIATAVGGVSEMIRHEETGILCPPGDTRALAESIERLLDNPGFAQRIGVRARKWGRKQWAIGRVVSDTLSIYHKAQRDNKYGIPDELFLHTVASHRVQIHE